jgi:eukaryotic-like serine/threonine-protein kinase
VEKAPPLAIVPRSPEPATGSDDAEVVRKWAAEPAKQPPRAVTIQGSSVPWRVEATDSRLAPGAQTPSYGRDVEPLPTAERRPSVTITATPPSPVQQQGIPSAAIPGGAGSAFRVGRYEVAARIARGAMGSVYVCRDTTGPSIGRLLTLKVVRQHSVKQDLAIASFNHEALIGSLFRHPNAQTVIDHGVFEDQPYLVLDYVDGGCLADLFTEQTRPTPAVVVTILLDVLTALGALHRTTDSAGQLLGLIHCDVSPENVLVGADGVTRLADFGSARFFATSNQAQPFSLSKPPWMPPEQFTGDRLDSSSDVYSAGVLLWTALTGHQPFAAEDYDQTVMNVMRKNVPPPSTLGAPACLDGVCMQALSRFRDRRFLLTDAMAAALRATASAEGLIASRETVGKWVQSVMGDELGQRRLLIASVFNGAHAPRDVGPQVDPSAPARVANRPRTPAGAEKVLSSRTIFMPAAAEAAKEEDESSPRSPDRQRTPLEQQRTVAIVAAAITLVVTLTVGLALKSWAGHRTRAARDPGAELAPPAAPPAVPPAAAPAPTSVSAPLPTTPPPAAGLSSPATVPDNP